jgi:hypothetical protein
MVALTVPQLEHVFDDGPALHTGGLPATPALFVGQDACELAPGGVADRPGEPVVGQHPCHIEVFDREPVVGLDQLVGDLVQEMLADVAHTMVVAAQRLP